MLRIEIVSVSGQRCIKYYHCKCHLIYEKTRIIVINEDQQKTDYYYLKDIIEFEIFTY